ncbi:FtsX-like permease family protein [Actinoplanes sp. NPDC051859]|uniref:FtsX-like permease family protein n=1 Tax=Actinoplanes sp. NPDC051859 TaxID=3363909 RepID=UPI0037B6714F
MRVTTLLRLAVAGNRIDHLRTVLTVLSSGLAAVALLAAATVGSIEGDVAYASKLIAERGLRPGVTVALIMLSLPVLALAGQCIRLGAPARDRRLAAIRLSGATPGQAVLIASAETVVAGLAGAVLGFGGFLAARSGVHRTNAEGLPVLPTDVLPAPSTIAAILLAVPLLAGLIGAGLLRRVVISPLGVVRRTRKRGPRPWPVVLIIAGQALFAFPMRQAELSIEVGWSMVISGAVLSALGVVLGTGWIAHTCGRLLHRYGRRPAMLLAGRQLLADPWTGSRTLAALLASVLVGAVALGLRALFETENRASAAYEKQLSEPPSPDFATSRDFIFDTIDLIMVGVGIAMAVASAGVLVTLAENIVARRRTYAALTAVGVPRRTLSEAVLWHTLAPVPPAVLLALAAGVSLARHFETEVSVGGSVAYVCDAACQAGSGQAVAQATPGGPVTLAVPVPMEMLAWLGGGALLAMLAVVGLGLLVLRSSTDLEELRAG